jgi:simple sugar transport system ATP-binding protein
LELVGLTKAFGDLVAVDGVSLALAAGEVHAVLGENGAGKTTLMNTVAGFLAPDAGTVLLDGHAMRVRVPGDALRAGIGMVHQHFRLIDQLTVAENLVLGSEEIGRIIHPRELIRRADELATSVGFRIDPSKPVWQLSVGEKQRVEIIRVLGRGARVLILDEPTAVLSPTEADSLCVTLKRMAHEDGVTVVFISHKLNEVLAVADRVTVMRRGSVAATLPRSGCDPDVLVRLMVGEQRHGEMRVRREASARGTGAIALDVADLRALDERGLPAVDGVSFNVRSGEIVGIAGVAGNGQKELEQVLVGLQPPEDGTVRVDGAGLGRRPARGFREAGGYIPEDRWGVGLVPAESIWRNSIIKSYRHSPIRRGPILSATSAKRYAQDLVCRVRLSTENTDTLTQHLSGGNAQKLLAGREIDGDPTVLVAVNPTQGLDVGAVDAVWQQIMAARDHGVAILLMSVDLDEVLELSDRVLVMYEGKILGEFERDEADRQRIGRLMAGGERPSATGDDGA